MKKQLRGSAEAAENLLDLAKAGCEAIFNEVTKILQKKKKEEEGDVRAYYWIDDESIRQTGLIPLGDAIMGLSSFLGNLGKVEGSGFREELIVNYREFLRDTAREFLLYCYSRSADDVLEPSDAEEGAPHFGGFPYVASGHVRRRRRASNGSKGLNGDYREDPEITVAVAYAVIVSRKILADLALWGQGAELVFWQKLFDDSLRYLLDIQLQPVRVGEGAGWAAFPRQELTPEEARGELFPTWMACKALLEVPEEHFFSDAASQARKAAVRWTVDALMLRAQGAGGEVRWAEYGTKGRSRLLDQVVALSILFENADPSDLVRAQQPLSRAVVQLLQACLDPVPAEPDYHLFRKRDLVGLVPWEDFSLLYWLLALLLTMDDWLREYGQSREDEDDGYSGLLDKSAAGESISEQIVVDSVRAVIQTPVARFVRRSLIRQHVESQVVRNKVRAALWPREGFRIYASWSAVANLVAVSDSEEFSSEPEKADDVFLALFRTLRSNTFASGISDQVVDFLRRQYNLF